MDVLSRASPSGRRRFASELARILLAAPLLDLLLSSEALAGDAHLRAQDLRAALVHLSNALRRGDLDPGAWQRQSAALCAELKDSQLLRQLRVERLVERLDADSQAPRSLVLDRDSPTPGIRHKLFTFARGEAILPHGHDNLVSLFVVLRGRFRARHYDRLADTPSHIVIRPTIDRGVETGDQTSISDAHDNVHWFTSRSEGALLYNLSVDISARSRRPHTRPRRVYLDPEGQRESDGTILAPRSDRRSLRAKYEAPSPQSLLGTDAEVRDDSD